MAAATFEPKLDTGTRAAADAIAVGETRSETKKLDSRKSKLLAPEIMINKELPRN